MKLVKDFPWVEIPEEEKKQLRHWAEDMMDRTRKGCHHIADKVQENYPYYRDRAEFYARQAWNYSEERGREAYFYCREHFPEYWDWSKHHIRHAWDLLKSKWQQHR